MNAASKTMDSAVLTQSSANNHCHSIKLSTMAVNNEEHHKLGRRAVTAVTADTAPVCLGRLGRLVTTYMS